ncbi:hypothetical protein QBC41DRAFT_307662 [Cercophora samala]|uniref:Uncharacterized protein n=1 Tax=Cercophora samala TaxID=330535 RepID=A0AA39YYI1_9PEZI|nr:hypothetical protein QBC41DRAFT_307662 [Cercophora samala]
MSQSTAAPDQSVSIRTFGHCAVQPQRSFQLNQPLNAFVVVAWLDADQQYDTHATASLVCHDQKGDRMIVGDEGYTVESYCNSQTVYECPDKRALAPDLAWDPSRPVNNSHQSPSTQITGVRPAVFIFHGALYAPAIDIRSMFVRVVVRKGEDPTPLACVQSRIMIPATETAPRLLSGAERWVLRKLDVGVEHWGLTTQPPLYEARWADGCKPSHRLSNNGVIRGVKFLVRNAHKHHHDQAGNIAMVLMAFHKPSQDSRELETGTDDFPHPMTRRTPDIHPWFKETRQQGVTGAHKYTWECSINEDLRLPFRGRWVVVAWAFQTNRSPENEIIGANVQQFYKSQRLLALIALWMAFASGGFCGFWLAEYGWPTGVWGI